MAAGQTIEERFDAVAGRLNAVHAELVDLAVDVLQDPDIWGSWECRTVEKFIAWRSGVTDATARKVVQIARRVDDLPLCLDAFRNGVLSLDQVAPIARRVPWYADEEICRQAKLMTVQQIARTASTYPWDKDIPKPDGSVDNLDRPQQNTGDPAPESTPETSTTNEPTDPTETSGSDSTVQPPDTVSFWWDDQRRFHLHGNLGEASGSIIENALTEARDRLFHNGQADVDWADSLLEVAERSIDSIDSPARRARFRVHVHRQSDGTTTNATGRGMTDADVGYITCDSVRSDVVEVDGVPISVGRSQHTAPDRTRRTVIHRDGGCRVPGCHDQRWLDVHHIIHWADGGPTDTDNLIALCNKHHRVHHQGRLGITGHADVPDGVHFTNRYGQPIRSSGARPQPPGERSATEQPAAHYRPALRERLESRWQHFNLPAGFRPVWDHDLQRTVHPRQHVG